MLIRQKERQWVQSENLSEVEEKCFYIHLWWLSVSHKKKGVSGCGIGWGTVSILQVFCVNQHPKWTKWVREQFLCCLFLSKLSAVGTKSQSPGSFSPSNGASGKCGCCSETCSALRVEQVFQKRYELHIVWLGNSPNVVKFDEIGTVGCGD